VGQRGLRPGGADEQRFALYGWCAAIRGVEGGGLVEGLPVHNFYTDAGDVAMKCPPIPITDRRGRSWRTSVSPRCALQGNRLRGVLQRAVCQQAEAVR